MTKRRLGRSRATQVRMEYLRLVNHMSKSKGWTLQSSLLTLWMDENSSQQSNKKLLTMETY